LSFGESEGFLYFAVLLSEVLEGGSAGGVEFLASFAAAGEVHVACLASGALQGFVPVLFEVAEAEVAGRDFDGVGGERRVRGQGTGFRDGIGIGAGGVAFGVSDRVEDFVFGDGEAAEFEAEFGGFEALGLDGVGEAAAGEEGVAVGDRDGAPRDGLQGLREEIDDGGFVLEEGDVDGAVGAGAEVAVVTVAVVVAAEGPVVAAVAVGFGVVALALGGGEAAGGGLLVELLHDDSPF
jgi:hypothetical protein